MLAPLADDDPTRIGPYRLRQRVGAGGRGVVYLAFGPDDRDTVVLRYSLYAANDSYCGPSGQPADVAFALEGDRPVVAGGGALPPASASVPLSHRWYRPTS